MRNVSLSFMTYHGVEARLPTHQHVKSVSVIRTQLPATSTSQSTPYQTTRVEACASTVWIIQWG